MERLKLALPVLATVTCKLSVLPSTTSPKRKILGLKVNWVAAAAGTDKPRAKKQAIDDRKNAYLYTDWGRVITFSVCQWVSDQ